MAVGRKIRGKGVRSQGKIMVGIRDVGLRDGKGLCAHLSNVASGVNRRPPCTGHVPSRKTRYRPRKEVCLEADYR